MKRYLLLAMLCAGSVASADTGTLPGGATIAFNRLFLHEGNSKTLVQPAKTPDSLWHYFNKAHCVCSFFQKSGSSSIDPNFQEGTFAYELLLQGQTTPVHRPLEIWVGTGCDDTVMRPMNCHQIMGAGTADISSIATTNGITPELPVYDLMHPSTAGDPGCAEAQVSDAEWAIADGDGDGVYDYFVSKAIDTDTLAPPLGTNFIAAGAENAIEIKWTAATGDVADIAYYQALCATELGNPAKTKPLAPRYITGYNLCGAPGENPKLQPVDIATSTRTGGASFAPDAAIDAPPDAPVMDAPDAGTPTDGGELPLPQGLAQADPAFICGESADATATSLRIDGLENGRPYTVVLLAIDKYGNAQGVSFRETLTPHAVTDFWEDLHGRGSKVEGGFCLIAETYGDDNPLTQALRHFRDDTLGSSVLGRALVDAYYGSLGKLGAVVHGHLVLRIVAGIVLLPLVAFALLWHLVTLPGLLGLALLGFLIRRRVLRARRLAPAMTVAILALAPHRAHAQAPYWDDPMANASEQTAMADVEDSIKWHAGLRLGPYVPGIDAQLNMPNTQGKGPYEAMFGGYAIMPMVDVDRFVWHGIGQLGVGLSAGYMSKSAHAWQDGSDPNDPNRPRSSGDENSFHLIPLVASAVYRFSYLDDEYGIPFVPYVRGGLGYYVWWISAPSGDFAKVCSGTGTEPSCSQNTAAGASLGLVGSIGLAIRAERIDINAARSMRESGIQHAGFYGELSEGWVDGFGKQTKLSVGAATWFAGVDFEF